jgi:pantetheine-phosphate adenylyltransferase
VKIALYPGTFDPITNGHLDIITRALRVFNRLVVAVAENPTKKPLFTLAERVEMAKAVVNELEERDRVEIIGFQSLTVDLAREVGATAIIRGLRAVSDFEYELMIALTNRKLAQDIESVFLMPSVEYIYLNSSMVKEVAKHGGNINHFVSDFVRERLMGKYASIKL